MKFACAAKTRIPDFNFFLCLSVAITRLMQTTHLSSFAVYLNKI
jgi:hypothetical protein